MNNRLFPRMCLVFPLIISFLFMPVNKVNASGYSSDADFWRWWYIEHQTDAITDGNGASAENIENTDSGQSAGTVIYNQSGVTRGDFIDYVEEQYNQAEGYIQNGVDYYVDAVNHVYDSTVTAATKAAYATQKAVREVVDASGNVIVDVSGSDFWHSAYNSLFNNNGYKDIYSDGTGDYSGSYNGNTFTCQFIGYALYNDYDSVCYKAPSNVTSVFDVSWVCDVGACSINSSDSNTATLCCFLFSISVNGQSYWCNFNAYPRLVPNTFSLGSTSFDSSDNRFYGFYNGSINNEDIIQHEVWISLFGSPDSVNNNSNPVLQPSQVGFIIYNGDRIPVYTDPSQNPFTVNDDGTVDYNGNTYPIYVDPEEISDDGWLKILEFIDNEDETENPYNPQGKPWNTQNDGSVLGGFFNNLITDIGNLFSGLIDKLKEIVNKIANFFNNFIDSIVNAIKKFIDLFIGDLDLDAMTDLDITNPFSMVQDCYDLLLELLGVNTT